MRLDGEMPIFSYPLSSIEYPALMIEYFAASGNNVDRKIHQKQVVDRHDDALNAARVKVPRYPY